MQNHKDQNYCNRLVANDTAIVHAIYKQWAPSVINFIKQQHGDVYDAQDIIQETVIVIYHYFRQHNVVLPCAFGTYFLSLCQHRWGLELQRRDTNRQVDLNALAPSEAVVEMWVSKTIAHENENRRFETGFQQLSNACKDVLLTSEEDLSLLKNPSAEENNKTTCLAEWTTLVLQQSDASNHVKLNTEGFDMFQKYQAKTMSSDVRLNFEAELNGDGNLKEAFQIYSSLQAYLEDGLKHEQEIGDFKANLDVISNQYFNALEAEALQPKPSKKSKTLTIAVVVVVFLIGVVLVFSIFANPSYEDYNDFKSISLMQRSPDDITTKLAEERFNTQDYARALEAFNEILEADFANLEIQMYKSIALVETNQFEEANHLLLKIIEGSSAYRAKAKWILALSHLKQDNIAACIDVLQSIPQDANTYMKAQQLLKRLE